MIRLIAITHQEWLQWIADGCIRCRDRVRLVSDRESDESLQALLACAPAFSLKDDQAIVFAQLIDGDTESTIDTASLPHSLKLEFVSEFFPLNERGEQLIAGDARRANVRLSSPHLSRAFEAWRDSELKRAAHEAGVRFLLSAGYSADESSQIQTPQPIDVDSWKPKGFVKYEKRRNYASFGCRVALRILEERVDPETWDQLRNRWGSPGFPEEADVAHVGGKAVCDWRWLRKQAQNVREYLQSIGQSFPLVQQAALAYWRDRLESHGGAGLERPDELSALARDLRIIEADEGTELAVQAAYLLGRTARRDTVNQLYYATHHNDFPALCVTARNSWLGERIPSIQELEGVEAKGARQDVTNQRLESAEAIPSTAPTDQGCNQLVVDGSSPEDVVSSTSKRKRVRSLRIPLLAPPPSNHGENSLGKERKRPDNTSVEATPAHSAESSELTLPNSAPLEVKLGAATDSVGSQGVVSDDGPKSSSDTATRTRQDDSMPPAAENF